jgi:hypothetical protein
MENDRPTKRCKHCAMEIDKAARICPYCRKPQANLSLFIAYFVIFFSVIMIITTIMGSLDKGTIDNNNNNNNNNNETEVKDVVGDYEVTLTSGHYTAGVDFPYGTYDLVVLSGKGNVSSSNIFSGGVNEMMGVPADKYYIDQFNNAKFEKGVIFSISGGLSIKITSNNAVLNKIVKRNNPIIETISLKSGNYEAGVDFPAGTYDLVATKGKGNVSSSNIFDQGINEMVGVPADTWYIKDFKNIVLSDGFTLEISGVEISLIPSK